MTEKVLNTLPTEKDPRDLNMEITDFLRKEDLKGKSPANEAVCNIHQHAKRDDGRQQTPPHQPRRDEGRGLVRPQQRTARTPIKAKSMCCFRCGLQSHVAKDCRVPAENILCSKCQSRNHVATMCSNFRTSPTQKYNSKPKFRREFNH